MPSDCYKYKYISLVLIARAVYLLERERTDATERPTHAGDYTAGVGNKVGLLTFTGITLCDVNQPAQPVRNFRTSMVYYIA